jgi:tRNA dimethylallyltransferase
MSTAPVPIFLAGPTAVGKSALALMLAERLGGEIISVDSMQVYRGMDIGTAKPGQAERQRVPHHLLDVVEVTEPFSAAEFVRRARVAAHAIQARGRVPIFCGGTGLYFKAYSAGLGEAPAADPALRAVLATTPLPQLLRELATQDPATFARIDPHNRRRVVRAVEVLRLTGRSFSAQRAPWTTSPGGEPRQPPGLWVGLSRAPADLRGRVDTRVEEMFARGLVEETRQLLARGLGQNPVALQALGYRQVAEYLRGERSFPATVALVQQRTRQFAKRQLTWFRRQLELAWVPLAPGTGVEAAATALAQRHAKLGL